MRMADSVDTIEAVNEGEPAVQRTVTIEVIGPLTVHRGGVTSSGSALGSRKARSLLALLAVDPRRLIRTDRIVDALWADRPIPQRPAQGVATVVSRLRARLGSATIVGGVAGYRLGDHVRVDLSNAATLVTKAEAASGAHPALASARQALDVLDRAEALEEWPEAKWADPARIRQVDLVRRARHVAAESALLLGDLRTAQDMAATAIAADRFDERACRLLMRACAGSGEPARALLAYEVLRTTLAVELGADPAAQTTELHVAILSGRTVAKSYDATAPRPLPAPGHRVPASNGPNTMTPMPAAHAATTSTAPAARSLMSRIRGS
jgi:DNA-binding SARP family transcriptional activator